MVETVSEVTAVSVIGALLSVLIYRVAAFIEQHLLP